MNRKCPTANVDVIGRLDSEPLEYVGNFIESRLTTKSFEEIKKPVWDTVGDSLEEIYLNSRRNHEAMIRQFDCLQEQKQLQGIANRNRIHKLNRDYGKLRDRLLAVNLFIREFAEKRRMVMKKFRQEVAMEDHLSSSNARMRQGLRELLMFRDNIKATAEEYNSYEKVLLDVVAQPKTFDSVKSLMEHCDSLMLTQIEIVNTNAEKVADLENMRKRFIEVAKDAALEVMGLKNTLSNVDRVYEAARYECLKWEATLQQVNEAIDVATQQKLFSIDGIKYLYQALCLRRGIRPSYLKLEQRLDFIKDEVEVLRELVAEFEDKEKADVEFE